MKVQAIGAHWRTLAAFALASAAAHANAASLAVQVSDTQGHGVPDAVVYAVPTNGKAPARPGKPAVIDQVKRRFVPLVTVVRAGTPVTFPNSDNIEHDVYSFSAAKTFELTLYSGVPSRPVVFDKPGLAILGCNIHDQMVAYVLVVDTPYFAKTDAAGRVRFDNLPAGSYEIRAWSHRMNSLVPVPPQPYNAPGDATAKFVIDFSQT